MDRATLPRTASRSFTVRQRGASIVEAVIALPILLVVILGAVQFALVYEAKATLNHATLQAARLGAVSHADPEALRHGLAQGLAALHTPDASLDAVARTIAQTRESLRSNARLRILNPSREAFEDFGVDVEGVREIPNDRLHARSTAPGTRSGINIQDANLLKVQVTYGYELHVPLVNWFIARVLLGAGPAHDAFEQQLLRRLRLPIVATATVRMQTPARLSDAVAALTELPPLARIPFDAPPPTADEAEPTALEADETPLADASSTIDGSGLDDAFFGFGSASADAGGPESPGGGSEELGAGVNGGSPLQCPLTPDPQPGFPFGGPYEGPLIEPRWEGSAPFAAGESNGATLGAITLASMAVGNPIHVATGNKFQQEIDIAPLPGVLGLALRRYYNSAAVGARSVLGAGWRHSYEASVRQNMEGTIELVQADGRTIVFDAEVQRGLSPAESSFMSAPAHVGPVRYIARRASDGIVLASSQGYRWLWRSGRELQFDLDGRLLRMRERGHVLELRYDARGSLSAVVDPQQRVLRFSYYPNGRLATVRGPGRLGIRYTYDGRGNLAQAVAIDGSARRYSYEDQRHPHHLSGIDVGSVRPRPFGHRAEFDRIARWAYDERGRAVYASHPNDAGKVTLDFAAGHTDVTDAFGRTTRYVIGWRDAIAFVREVRGPGCGPCGGADARYRYDARWQPLEIAAGATTLRYAYDALGRLQQIDRVIRGATEWVVRYAYDGETARVVRIERPSVKAGAVAAVELEYQNGVPVRIRERGFAPSGSGYVPIERGISLAYDARGRLVSVDGPRLDVEDLTELTYDDLGRLTLVRTAAGSTHLMSYDTAGRPTRVARTGHPDLALEYDVHGRLTAMATLRSRGWSKVTYEYDPAGRLVQIVDTLGRRTRYGFDAAGRPDRLSRSDSDITIAARYAPDARLERIAALGRDGRALRTLYYAYDVERRLIEVRDGEGPPLRQLAYLDADALADRMTDPLGHDTWLSYDALGRLRAVRAPDGGSTRWEYDAQGRARTLIAPNDTRTLYQYDDFGRRIMERSADRGETRYVYDPADNLIAKTDARGATTRLRYDAGNRLIAVERAESIATLHYANGRLTSIDDGVMRERYDYDRDGQLIEHRRVVGKHEFATRFTYDAQGRLQTRTLPSGARLRYRYGRSGALESINQERWLSDRLLLQTRAHGRAVGRVDAGLTTPGAGWAATIDWLGFVSGNGIATHTTFNAKSGNMRRRQIEGVAALEYEFDAADRIVSIRRDAEASHYTYDAVGRLSAAITPTETLAYRYDLNGNRLWTSSSPHAVAQSAAGDGGSRQSAAFAEDESEVASTQTRYAYQANSNRLIVTDAAAPHTYDAAGNPLTIAGRRYEYDSRGRPTKLFEGQRLIAEYRYNFWGERVQKILYRSGQREVTTYLYEQHRLRAEADERGRIRREYLYVDHHPAVLLENGLAHWIHTDHLGTPIAVTNRERKVLWRAQHRPFGAATVDADPDRDGHAFAMHLRLPGQYFDAESGTHYNYFREYDPKTGRYLTPDPVGMAAGSNVFAYAMANPISQSDRLGLYQEDIHYYMTLFLAITAGIDPATARHIALASAFVDVNASTRPIDPTTAVTTVLSAFENQPQLLLYHFVLADPETGRTLPPYDNSNYYQVATALSPQLTRMLEYSRLPPQYIVARPPCASDASPNVQFFGEFLHALADTYAHRDSNDRPYDATRIGLGIGHTAALHHPDYTYNADGWITRETRTLEMELAVRDVMRSSQWAEPMQSTTATQFDTLIGILREFNTIRENEQDLPREITASDFWRESQKVERLNRGLIELGYSGIDLLSTSYVFDTEAARTLRSTAFRGLNASFYDQAILTTE